MEHGGRFMNDEKLDGSGFTEDANLVMVYVNGVGQDGILIMDGGTFVVENGDDVIDNDISTMTSRLEGWTSCQE